MFEGINAALAAFDRAIDDHQCAQFTLTGFSIGAMMAIKIAAARPQHVKSLTLISAAAPLQLGNFLPDMAGKPIFDMAQNRPKMLSVVTKIQSYADVIMPDALMRQLFANSGPADRNLLTDPKFRKIIKQGFHNSFREKSRWLHRFAAGLCCGLVR